jgi:hypothetical protein
MPVDLRLALLVCDEPAPHIKTICGDYEQSKIFTRLLSSSLARTNSGVTQTFLLDTYDVFKDSKDHQMASTMMAFSSPDLVRSHVSLLQGPRSRLVPLTPVCL